MKFFKKISSVLLAFLVLLSTFSFTVEKHFCGDFLVDVSYFGNADDCGKDMSSDSCDAEKQQVKKKSCCKDEVEKIQGQNQLQKSSVEKISFEKQQFVLAFVVSYYNLFNNLSEQVVLHKNYSPPNLVADIQVLYEVFII